MRFFEYPHFFRFFVFFVCGYISATVSNASAYEGSDECDGHPVFVTRDEWRARKAARTSIMRLPVSHVVILHTVSLPCFTTAQCIRMVQFIQDSTIDERGHWDISYNFLIGGDGRVYVGVGFNGTGSHTINMNTKSLGVSFIGNFAEVAPSKKMLDAAQDLIECGIRKGYLTPVTEIHGHRDVTCSLAPGDVLYNIIRTWKRYKGGKLKEYDCSGFL